MNKNVLTEARSKTSHNKNGIIIQFILFELIQAGDLIGQIDASLRDIGEAYPRKLEKGKHSSIQSIASAIHALAGSSQKSMRIFTSNLNEGILAQTKNYCAYFASNLDPKDPDCILLQKNSNRAWTLSLDCMDMMRSIQQKQVKELSDFALFDHSFRRMSIRVKKLTCSVAHMLPQFWGDENVLLFLLTRKHDLDRLYGKEFVLNLFEKMFPNGLSEVEKFMVQKYEKRGFTHLIREIQEKIAEFDTALV